MDDVFKDSALILFQGFENCKNNFLEDDIKESKSINLNINDYKRNKSNKKRCC